MVDDYFDEVKALCTKIQKLKEQTARDPSLYALAKEYDLFDGLVVDIVRILDEGQLYDMVSCWLLLDDLLFSMQSLAAEKKIKLDFFEEKIPIRIKRRPTEKIFNQLGDAIGDLYVFLIIDRALRKAIEKWPENELASEL